MGRWAIAFSLVLTLFIAECGHLSVGVLVEQPDHPETGATLLRTWNRTIGIATLSVSASVAAEGQHVEYNVIVGGREWLRGAPPAVHCDGLWYSADPDDETVFGVAPLSLVSVEIANDVQSASLSTSAALGACDMIQLTWELGNSSSALGGTMRTWVTTFSACSDAGGDPHSGSRSKASERSSFVFTQKFADGCPNANSTVRPENSTDRRPGDQFMSPLTSMAEFPAWSAAFNLPTTQQTAEGSFEPQNTAETGTVTAVEVTSTDMLTSNEIGHVTFSGTFAFDQSQGSFGLQPFSGGTQGGPLILFNASTCGSPSTTAALVMSPLDEFSTGVLGRRSPCAHASSMLRAQWSQAQPVILTDIDFDANDLYSVANQSSVDDCVDACFQDSRCAGYSWGPEGAGGGTCYLKHSARGATARPGHLSGSACGSILSSADWGQEVLAFGPRADIEFLPVNFSLSMILVPPSDNAQPANGRAYAAAPNATMNSFENGINGAAYRWGKALQKAHRTARIDRSNDLVVRKLGMWTDNGGYFYGGANSHFNATTLENLFVKFREYKIPVSYIQLDPWWFRDEWVARPDYFPKGLRDFQNNIGVPLLLYSYYWSEVTPSLYQNNFSFDSALNYYTTSYLAHMTQVSPADAYRFYSFIFSSFSDILAGVEVDFSNYMPALFPSFNAEPGKIEEWEFGLATAAKDVNVSVQYCMPLASQLLASLQFPAVTNARASGDNFPVDYNGGGGHDPTRWMIPYTSLLHAALGLAPFMDVIWTSASQPGNPYSVTRHNIELQAIVAALSSGPVGIGDGPGFTNTSLVNLLADGDGTLIHPSVPATPLDAMYFPGSPARSRGKRNPATGAYGHGRSDALNHSTFRGVRPSGQLFQTHCAVPFGNASTLVFPHVLAVDIDQSYSLSPASLWPLSQFDAMVAVPLSARNRCSNGTAAVSCVIPFNSSSPLMVSTSSMQGEEHAFELFSMSPMLPGGFALLGDFSKFVVASPARFASLTLQPVPGCSKNDTGPPACSAATGGQHLRAEVVGVPGDSVELFFLVPELNRLRPSQQHGHGFGVANSRIVSRNVTLSAAGTATVVVP